MLGKVFLLTQSTVHSLSQARPLCPDFGQQVRPPESWLVLLSYPNPPNSSLCLHLPPVIFHALASVMLPQSHPPNTFPASPHLMGLRGSRSAPLHSVSAHLGIGPSEKEGLASWHRATRKTLIFGPSGFPPP